MHRKNIVNASGFGAAVVLSLLAGCHRPEPQPETPQPVVSTMKVARASSKSGVPVALRYEFDGEVASGRPVTLHLAAVPSVEGSNLNVSIKDTQGIKTSALALSAHKAVAATAYRQSVSVTRDSNGPAELRVLVTMDLPEGSAFGWFGVPLGGEPVAGKKLKAPLE